jgi:hypothetical protein
VLAITALAGCGGDADLNGPPAAPEDSALSGIVHGGQQPVSGATITLYAPGHTGYGSSPSVLVTTTSGSDGTFTLPRPYTCPSSNDVLTYITATGGNSGSGPNSVLALAAVLPACASLSSSTFISLNEATTVAAAYTLAPFAALSGTTTNIGASATNNLGLQNTLGPFNNLVNIATGNARSQVEIANVLPPTSEINTLADILAACVNTAGSTLSTAACGQLFTAATPPAGTAPNDTFQAAIDIALNPGNNAAALYALSSSTAPFQPTLTSAPGDFAVGIVHSGGQLANSAYNGALAIDAQGNAWVSNASGTQSFSEISPSGVFLSGAGDAQNYAYASAISIDQNGNLFWAAPSVNAIGELNSSGTPIAVLTPASLNVPWGIAVDNNHSGALWITESGDNSSGYYNGTTVTDSTSAGVDTSSSPYSGANGPLGTQIDGSGNIWVANSAYNLTTSNIGSIMKFTPPVTSGAYTTQAFTVGLDTFPTDIAIDHSGNVWTTAQSKVAELSNSGSLLSGTGYASAAGNTAESIMIDGLGRAFVSNLTGLGTGGSLTVFNASGTLISTANSNVGYLANGMIVNQPWYTCALAIDPSGNVWISGHGTLSGFGFVTEIVGIAAPVTTPNSVAASSNKYGIRP